MGRTLLTLIAAFLAHPLSAEATSVVKFSFDSLCETSKRIAHVTCISSEVVETEDGIRNIDAIAATKGVDCLWIGHFDLSCPLGIPGQFDHPEFKKASFRVKRAARKHDRALGRLAGTPEETIALHRQGYDLLCCSGDVWV